MHSLAKTANTSVGSLYHFFPDRESVLKSVAERHALALHEIADRLRAVPDATWRQLNAEEAIRELLLPYTDYVRRHADFVQLMRSPELAPQAQDFVKLIDRILALRLPATPTRRRRIYTEMLHAVAAGTVHLAYQLNPSKLDVWLEEVQRVLAAYLMELERCAEPVEGAEGKQAPVSRSGKRR
jgi:AcrR family transcriptional regulator